MRIVTELAVFAGLVGLLASCGAPSKREAPPAIDTATQMPQLKRITLGQGSSISVAVDTDGNVEIIVVQPPGRPGAGTYTSTAEALFDDATAAKNSLGDPNTVITIGADADGRIVTLSHEVTMR